MTLLEKKIRLTIEDVIWIIALSFCGGFIAGVLIVYWLIIFA
jgi:hypothetical protein